MKRENKRENELLAKNPREITEAEWLEALELAKKHFDEYNRIRNESDAKYVIDGKGPWTVGDVTVRRYGGARDTFIVTGESVNRNTQKVADKVEDVVVGLVAEKTGIEEEDLCVAALVPRGIGEEVSFCNPSPKWIVRVVPVAPTEEYALSKKLRAFADAADYVEYDDPLGGRRHFTGDYSRRAGSLD